jgi:hypothetical protein
VRLFRRLSILVCLLAILASCSTASTTSTTSTSNPQPSPASSPSSSALRVEPPKFTLIAQAGEQQANQGSYFWQHQDNGLAVEAKARGIPVHEQPLAVARGEQLRIEAGDGSSPETMELKVYPKEGNHGPIATEAAAIDAFNPATPPVTETTLQGGNFVWTADLEPGDYFLWM